MAFILPANRYDDIRRALDPLIDSEMLPTEVIESDIYLGEAERWIVALDPIAATRTGGELNSVYRAIIRKTAAILSPAYPQARQINMAGHTGTFTFAETPAERTARLDGEALDAVIYYIPALGVVSLDIPTFFTTVSGRRA